MDRSNSIFHGLLTIINNQVLALKKTAKYLVYA